MAESMYRWLGEEDTGALYSQAGVIPKRDLTEAEWERHQLEGSPLAGLWAAEPESPEPDDMPDDSEPEPAESDSVEAEPDQEDDDG